MITNMMNNCTIFDLDEMIFGGEESYISER